MRCRVMLLMVSLASTVWWDGRRVAVLPFDDISTSRNEQWLEKGMSAQVGWDLMLSREMRVAQRAQVHQVAQRVRSTERLSSWGDAAPYVGRRLHADWIVFGSFQRDGDRLQIEARLLEVPTGRLRDLIEVRGRWFELLRFQDDIAERVLLLAGVTPAAELQQRMAFDPTTSVEAYEKFARAFSAWDAEEHPGGDKQEAARLYAEALAIDPNYPKALNNLGIVHEHLGQIESAEHYYRDAMRLKTARDISPYLNLANILMKTVRINEALAECDAARAVDPQSVRPYLKKGFIHLTQKRDDLAEAEFRAALRVDPECAMARLNLGVIFFNAGQNDAAESEFRKVIDLQNDVVAAAYAHNNLGNVLRRRRRRDEALAEYLAALKEKEDYAVAAMNAGDIFMEKKQREEAIRWYDEALRLDPGLEMARRKRDNARRS